MLGNPGNITLPFEGFDLRRMSRMVQFNCRGSLFAIKQHNFCYFQFTEVKIFAN